MDFGESIKTVFKKYAEFEGVAGRSEFWWFTLFTAIISVPIQIFLEMIDPETAPDALLLPYLIVALVGLAWSLGILLPSLAVGVRRLRDAGYHWAWMFLNALPIIGWIVLIVFWAQPSKPAVEQ